MHVDSITARDDHGPPRTLSVSVGLFGAFGGRLAFLAILTLLTGCGSGAGDQDATAAKQATSRWLRASATGDGATFCRLLSRNLHGQWEREATKNHGRNATCEQVNSARPPGWTRREVHDLSIARKQAVNGLRIQSASVHGDAATVRFSWRVPQRPSPILSFSDPDHDGQVEDQVHLIRQGGSWKVACGRKDRC